MRTALKRLGAVAAVTLAAGIGTAAAQEGPSAASPGWLERDTLSGDWGGARPWLKSHGITLAPRLTQFYQGLSSGEGDHPSEYGGKLDLMLDADLARLGLWKGLSLRVHAEYNLDESVNLEGGTIMPVNTALMFPGMKGADAFDFSAVQLKQTFGDSTSLIVGKVSIIDYCVPKPFMGGGGYDSFWNIVFAAPPSGTVPAYFFGALLSVRTEAATYGLWVYDPNSSVNKAGLDHAFANGVTIRGSVSFPVSIGGLSGHQGFAVSYSNKEGTDLETLDDIPVPEPPAGTLTKDDRYYFAYTLDQYLHRSKEHPEEGVGLFGQFGISDGNPNVLFWQAFAGVGGTGLIPTRSRDKWGVGYYYAAWSRPLEDAVAPTVNMRDEQGFEMFYNLSLTPWLVLGAHLQVIKPGLASETAVFPGLHTVIRF
jgi:porin